MPSQYPLDIENFLRLGTPIEFRAGNIEISISLMNKDLHILGINQTMQGVLTSHIDTKNQARKRGPAPH
jgi:hypothetical protein